MVGGVSGVEAPASNAKVLHQRLVVAVLVSFLAFGVLTGFADILASLALTGQPFAVVGRLVLGGHWEAVFAYILGHNMGLASVVPAVGLTLVARYDLPTRRLALRTLLASSCLALVWGLLLFPLPDDPSVAILFGLEAIGVMLLAIPSYLRLSPDAAHGSGTRLAPKLVPWLLAAFAVLAAAAFYETLLVAGLA